MSERITNREIHDKLCDVSSKVTILTKIVTGDGRPKDGLIDRQARLEQKFDDYAKKNGNNKTFVGISQATLSRWIFRLMLAALLGKDAITYINNLPK